jgi:hypothetical protein
MPISDGSCVTSDLIGAIVVAGAIAVDDNIPLNNRRRFMQFCLNSMDSFTSLDPHLFTDGEKDYMRNLLTNISNQLDRQGYFKDD